MRSCWYLHPLERTVPRQDMQQEKYGSKVRVRTMGRDKECSRCPMKQTGTKTRVTMDILMTKTKEEGWEDMTNKIDKENKATGINQTIRTAIGMDTKTQKINIRTII